MEIKKIYFDMDGVLVDFDRGVRELGKFEASDQLTASKEQEDMLWRTINKIEHFYDKLKPMPGALEMFNKVYEKYGEKVEILTGVPKPKRGMNTAGEDKIQWAHRILSPTLKVNVVYKEEKKNFCTGPECILIDDLITNINSWRKSGGTGILHISAEDTIKRIAEAEQKESKELIIKTNGATI